MAIQIGDVVVTKRWKTVEDSRDDFFRLATMFQACDARNKVRKVLDDDKDESNQVLLRIKRHVGFYFVQARLK